MRHRHFVFVLSEKGVEIGIFSIQRQRHSFYGLTSQQRESAAELSQLS